MYDFYVTFQFSGLIHFISVNTAALFSLMTLEIERTGSRSQFHCFFTHGVKKRCCMEKFSMSSSVIKGTISSQFGMMSKKDGYLLAGGGDIVMLKPLLILHLGALVFVMQEARQELGQVHSSFSIYKSVNISNIPKKLGQKYYKISTAPISSGRSIRR